MDRETAHTRLLDAAERLFDERGIKAVGMAEIRDVSGVPMKRLYQIFPAKELLVVAYLERHDVLWRRRLTAHVDAVSGDEERVLAVFDWLRLWFSEPGFRGCVWTNAFSELGAVSQAVVEQVRNHKSAFHEYLRELLHEVGIGADLAEGFFLLAEGAMTSAGIFSDPSTACRAGSAARLLLAAR